MLVTQLRPHRDGREHDDGLIVNVGGLFFRLAVLDVNGDRVRIGIDAHASFVIEYGNRVAETLNRRSNRIASPGSATERSGTEPHGINLPSNQDSSRPTTAGKPGEISKE